MVKTSPRRPDGPAPTGSWSSTCGGLGLLQAQLAGIDAWHREDWEHLDLGEVHDLWAAGQRRRELRAREQWALDFFLDGASERLVHQRPPTVVLAHRNEHLLRRLSIALSADGVTGHASALDAAMAIAALIVVQPDVLLLSQVLPGAPGWQLTERARTLSPRTRVLVQVEDDRSIPGFLTLGAALVLSRRQTATQLLQAIRNLMIAPPAT